MTESDSPSPAFLPSAPARMRIGAIERRIAAIRWTMKKACAAAPVDASTVTRAKQGAETRNSKLVAIEAAVAAEEIRLRDYLMAVHPPVQAGPAPDVPGKPANGFAGDTVQVGAR